MRTYKVKPGDSPGSIAAEFAGCPKCSRDLIAANNHKQAATLPNGYITFRDLRVGERINLPSKWFDGRLDDRPKAYFTALPYPDGTTPSMLGNGSAGVLGDYAALDVANAKVSALAPLNDHPFIVAVDDTASAVDAAVREITAGPALANADVVRSSTARARARNADLNEAFVSGSTDTLAIRNDILNDFSAAMVGARAALKTFYEPSSAATPTSTFPPALASAAQAVASAIGVDENYCASVAHAGTVVNTAVHAFKTAWNASQSPPLPLNTGNYEQATAEAIAAVLGGAPIPCDAHVAPAPTHPTPVAATTAPVVIQKTGLSTGAIFGIGLLGAAAVGGAVHLATRKPIRGRRPARRKR